MIKLYGTLGPSCRDEKTLCDMINAGMTGIRLNLSHGSLESFSEYLLQLHKAEEKCGKKMELVIDMEGPEMRIGNVNNPINLSKDEIVVLGKDIPLDKSIVAQLEAGDICRINDGKIELEAKSPSDGGFVCVVKRGGEITSRKSFTVIGKAFIRPVLTQRDIDNIRGANKYGVSAILQPFVHGKDDVSAVRKILDDLGCFNIKIMSKIEDRAGIEKMEEIVSASDYIVFARGDLGNSIDMWKLPKMQKRLALICKTQGKPFIVATQLLASMEKNPTPTRAEMNDIFNCAVDGALGLMLTGETAAGEYPAQAIYYLSKAAKEGESF